MFLRSGVSSEHLEEGRLPQMFRNPSPRQKMCLNQKNIGDNKTSNSNLSIEFNLKLYFWSFYALMEHPSEASVKVSSRSNLF